MRAAHTMDIDTFQFLACGRAVLSMKKSLVRHQLAGPGIFATIRSGRCIVAGYYYCSLLYADVSSLQNLPFTYVEHFMEVPSKKVKIFANHLREKVLDRNSVDSDM